MAELFSWSDEVERSGINKVTVSDSIGGNGSVVVTVHHAGTGISVLLPRYAVKGLVANLADHLDTTDPVEAAVEAALFAEFPQWQPDTRWRVRRTLAARLRERGITGDVPPST